MIEERVKPDRVSRAMTELWAALLESGADAATVAEWLWGYSLVPGPHLDEALAMDRGREAAQRADVERYEAAEEHLVRSGVDPFRTDWLR